MRKLFTYFTLSACLLVSKVSSGIGELWQQVPKGSAPSKEVQVIKPLNFLVYTFNEDFVKLQMFNLSTSPDEGMILSLPLPNGNFRDFKVWQDPMMPADLAAKYPEIKTFTGVAVDDQRVTAKLDFTLYGFHAMVFDGENTSFVDPFDRFHDGYYLVHYKKDEYRPLNERMKCEVKDENNGPAGEAMTIDGTNLPKMAARTVNGWNLRTYRLALSADHFYCQAATGSGSPTIAACLSCMTTSMNRINGVYEHEFSVHMNFCSKEDTLIWPTASGSINGADPFNTIDANGGACLSQNQPTCTNRVGSANFDLGHVFTTGGGGISSLGVVCNNGAKAQSCTGSPTPVGDGYDIDYVAHEMGHEFGSEHTFNNNIDGSCQTNAVSAYAYEPGSGVTIMAYAGICPPDDLTIHSDPNFHTSSLVQITTQLNGAENACAVVTSTSNKLASIPTFSANYTIPYKTPFEIYGPTAVDSVADSATTYNWDQWNLGDFGKRLNQTFVRGPIFRSFTPTAADHRVFPTTSMVLSGNLSNAGVEGAEGEKAPDTARFLTFKLTVRDILNGKGCFTFPDDTIHINATQTPTFTGFAVTSQGTTGISYNGGTSQTITWNVVGTNAAPVNAANVTIYMSVDAGYTWPYSVATVPNTGTATVTIPNPASTSSQARFKVKGSGNVFFNVNKSNFTVTHNSAVATTPTGVVTPAVSFANDVKIYPVPATDVVHFSTGTINTISTKVIDAVGRIVWEGTISGTTDINVSSWAKGVYHVIMMNNENGDRAVKSIVIQ